MALPIAAKRSRRSSSCRAHELAPAGKPLDAGAARGQAAKGVIQFIGGSYLAATPQLSYRRLLEALARQGLEIQAWSYVPGFDHQAQANEAWRLFRTARPESLSPLCAWATVSAANCIC